MNRPHTGLSESSAVGPQSGISNHHVWKVACWILGGLFLSRAVLTMALLIVVPLFGLENDQWQRPGNPITVYKAVLHLNVGALYVLAARSSGKRRFVWAGLAIVTWIGLGTRDLGIVAW